MENKFELLEHTADTGIIAFGETLARAFELAAEGMFSIITDIDTVAADERRDISITAADRESLLIGWLNELIFLFDTENRLFSKFEITEMDDRSLKAELFGEKVDTTRHTLKTGIKAATWHMLKVTEGNPCRVQVLFDI